MSPASSATSCARAGRLARGVGLPARAGAARRACAARRSPNSPASASTGTSAWSRAAPSARRLTTVDALARALRLNEMEQEHLRALARGGAALPRETVPADLLRVDSLTSLPTSPAGAGTCWPGTPRPRTSSASTACPGRPQPAGLDADQSHEAARLFGAGWAGEAGAWSPPSAPPTTYGPATRRSSTLLRRLREGCPEFDAWWERHDVRTAAPASKSFEPPDPGRPALPPRNSFQFTDDPALKLVIYTPV